MRRTIILAAFLLAACNSAERPISQQLPNFEEFDGFVDMYWDDSKGRLLLKIEAFDEPFLYQSSLARGVGSNDLFLDRGQGFRNALVGVIDGLVEFRPVPRGQAVFRIPDIERCCLKFYVGNRVRIHLNG